MTDNSITLKRMIQRTEWCEEFHPHVLLEYMVREKISSEELLAFVKAYSSRKEYTLNRFLGKQPFESCFQERYLNVEQIDGSVDKNVSDYKLKVCFITCYTDEDQLREMNYWIDRLHIPNGVEVEKRALYSAKSMCAGYNEMMYSSDAKYKVYLHQDIRIINTFFIDNLLAVFNKCPNAGMVGMVGTKCVPSTGVMWDAERFGSVVECSKGDDKSVAYTVLQDNYHDDNDVKVVMIDGFLMATSVDLWWREDVFDGWDFYDASCSVEFIKRGYDIIVPRQTMAWCLHDFGEIHMEKYDYYRELFVKEYS
ncbi:glycosyltransferase family protein [Butyrivibrio sp. YAB3001]|uniref:glycosyltransferase family protein n=1 Tax=Butyrivibrio sp. YAB3001 TaxID=1520812 RepID=UPI0008F64BBA|nr:glycosyltransferase family protein [Butyrivibrio sp. YAB3001]SFB94940.1 Glycosyltransferase like family protein [Butyrivibrio sp. YAB3001]